MKNSKKRIIAWAAALAVCVTVIPQNVWFGDQPAQTVSSESGKEAQKAAEAKKAEEAQKAAEAKKAEEAQKAAEAKKAEEAQKAAEAQKAEEAQKAAEAKKAEEAQKAADAKKAEEAQKAAEAKKAADARKAEEAQKADASKKDASEDSARDDGASGASADAAAKDGGQDASAASADAKAAGTDEGAASADAKAAGTDEGAASADAKAADAEVDAAEAASADVAAADAADAEAEESDDQELKAAAEDTEFTCTDAAVAAPALSGTYFVGDSVSSLAEPSVVYTFTETTAEDSGDPMSAQKSVSGAGSWQYATDSAGPWSELTQVPNDKTTVYVRYLVPAGKVSFTDDDGAEHTVDVPEAASDAVVMNRKYPQLFNLTLSQNAGVADYAYSMSGFPGISITLTLIGESGKQVGTATQTMNDMPSSRNLVSHFLNADWSINRFGLKASDINQNVRILVTQNPVDGDVIAPCDPFYSNVLYLVSSISGSVSIPSEIHVGDDVTLNIDKLRNPSKLALTYQWYLGAGDAAKAISGADTQTYTVAIEDLVNAGSKVLSCKVTDVRGMTLASNEVTVLPLDLSSGDVLVDWDEDAVYTGKKTFPEDITVSAGSYDLPEDMWKVSSVKGKNCVKIGKGWMRITGIGEYVIGSLKKKYTIVGDEVQATETKKKEAAKAADLTVTDSKGRPKKYEIRIVTELPAEGQPGYNPVTEGSAQAEDSQSTSGAQAEGVKVYEIRTFDDSVTEDGIIYSLRKLNLSRAMIEKAKAEGCSLIRFRAKTAGIDLSIPELVKDSYAVILSPLEDADILPAEKDILDQYHPEKQIYRVSVQAANEKGEIVDVIDTMLKARVLLYGAHEEGTQMLQISHDELQSTVNDAYKMTANGEEYLSAAIYVRSLFTGTLVSE